MKNFSFKLGLNVSDTQILEPFINEFGGDIVDQVKCIYTSGQKKSYLVKFRTGSEVWKGSIVLKAFLKNKKDQCEIETQNILWISSLNARLPNSFVQIPEVVWSKPDSGLFASRWIPGVDMDATIKRTSRLWNWQSPQPYIRDFEKLLRWLKGLSAVGQKEIDRKQAIKRDQDSWEKFLNWFYGAEKFDYSWRIKMIARLEEEQKLFDEEDFHPGPFHNDFTPCNVRRDPGGHFWVLDWRWLEIGHWLEAAYQFSYALRKYSYTLFSRYGYFKAIYTPLEKYLLELEPDEWTHRYYRLHTIMRYLRNLGQQPAESLKRKMIIRYWMRELSQHLA